MEKPIITPKTKVYDLLEAYPSLENTLLGLTPQFKKLKNPVLRNTIARITTLAQAASIGGLNVEEMVNTLRKEAGQDLLQSATDSPVVYNTSKPQWFDHHNLVKTIDISVLLNAGEQPVHEVLSSLKTLKPGEILEVKAPFLPAPLLDKSISMDYAHWLLKVADDQFLIYFTKK